jgi:hypothetical protein
LLILDQLDSALANQAGPLLVDLALLAGQVPGAKVLAVSRTWDARTRERLNGLIDRGFHTITASLLPAEEAAGVLSNLGYGAAKPQLVEMARNLLSLTIIADLAGAGVDISALDSTGHLWDAFRKELSLEADGAVLAEAVRLARAAIRARGLEFEVTFPYQGPQAALLSRETIVQVTQLRARFRHDAIVNHLVAWDAVQRSWKVADLITQYGEDAAELLAPTLTELYAMHQPHGVAELLKEL